MAGLKSITRNTNKGRVHRIDQAWTEAYAERLVRDELAEYRRREPLHDEARGRALGVQMLREANAIGLDALAFREDERDGKPQLQLVLKYLDLLRGADRRAQIGFSSVLTDFIATCCDGAPAVDLQLYARALH